MVVPRTRCVAGLRTQCVAGLRVIVRMFMVKGHRTQSAKKKAHGTRYRENQVHISKDFPMSHTDEW